MISLIALGLIVLVIVVPATLLSSFNTNSMENTAKNFALQLGSLVSLYVSITALIMMLFGIITIQYPDVAQGYYEYDSASSGIRFGIALLIVFFPTYILLTRLVNNIRRREQGTYLMLTKWLIYLSLLIGGATILGDLVAVVNSFLMGELTIRFVLKALSFFIVVSAAFVYYLLDAKGYWQANEKISIQYAGGVAVFVVIALILGFTRVEPPTKVREMKIDAQQINDLSIIQSGIEEYYAVNGNLPDTIDDVYVDVPAPTAPEGRTPYSYNLTSAGSFELCARFESASSKAEQAQYSEPMFDTGRIIKNPYNWTHAEGNVCFSRTLNVMDASAVPSVPVKK